MDDLEAAKATIATAQQSKDDNGVYRVHLILSLFSIAFLRTTVVPEKPREGTNGYDSPSWLRPYAPSMAMRRNRPMCMAAQPVENSVRQQVAWRSVNRKRLASRQTT
jgi:glucan phosphorylase